MKKKKILSRISDCKMAEKENENEQSKKINLHYSFHAGTSSSYLIFKMFLVVLLIIFFNSNKAFFVRKNIQMT